MQKFIIVFMIIFYGFESFPQSALAIEVPMVTVYVHGTTTKFGLRLLSKFCKKLVFGQPGIHNISELPADALLRIDAEFLAKKAPDRFCFEHFYTFGWSGTLNFKAREQAGQILFDELNRLLADYKNKYGLYPKLRIMTFSHGGNVALNMAQYLPFLTDEHINLELLLIACPVQKMTEPFIEHPEIDHLYTIASSRDLLQVIDAYKFNKKRYFPTRFFNTYQSNCKQIKILINNRGLSHLDLLRSFIWHLPDALNMADAWYKQNMASLHDAKDQGVEPKSPLVATICLQDPEFRFFNGFNIMGAASGKRKKKTKMKKLSLLYK